MILLNIYFDKYSKHTVRDFANGTAHKLEKELVIQLLPQKHQKVFVSKAFSSNFKNSCASHAYSILLTLEHFLLRFIPAKNAYNWALFEQIDFALLEELLDISEINIYLTTKGNQRNITKARTLTLAIEDDRLNPAWAGLEVIHEHPSTIVSMSMRDSNLVLLQKLSGRFPTMNSVTKNIIFMSGVALQMSFELIKNYTETKVVNPQQKEVTANFFYREFPQLTVSNILRYSSWQFIRIVSTKLARARKVKVSPRWQIAFAMRSWDDLCDAEIQVVSNPEGRSLADPFVVTWDEQTVIFVEDIELQSGKGSISVIDFDSTGGTNITPCIQEKFHLSFPFTFEFQGELYMCPESSNSNSIRIYKCREFPHGWDFVREIISGIEAVDTIIFPSNGLWWMLTGISNLGYFGRMSELHCFYSTNPLSTEWLPHDPEIVVRDSLCGRNGGYFLDPSGMIRVGQTFGFQSYGKGLSMSRLTNISENTYEERKIVDFLVNKDSVLTGLHHLTSSRKLSAFDILAPNDLHGKTTFEKLGIAVAFPDVVN